MGTLFVELAEEVAAQQAEEAEKVEGVVLPCSLNHARAVMSVAVLDYMLGLDGLRSEVQHAYLEV
jgi:hypothetical protein